jgi:hypothetical protein
MIRLGVTEDSPGSITGNLQTLAGENQEGGDMNS